MIITSEEGEKFMMKKVARVIFEFEDGTAEMIDEPSAAAMFQSRCNSSGILSGFGEWLKPVEEAKDEKEQPSKE